MVSDLGIDPTEERLRDFFNEYDVNKDGLISFPEFSHWWLKDECTYVIKRSEPIKPKQSSSGVYSSADDISVPGSRNGPLAPSAGSVRTTRSARSASAGRLRPSAAAGGALAAIPEERSMQTAAKTMVASRKDSGSSSGPRMVPMPIVSYRGSNTTIEVAGLEANRLYHFRLRFAGSRSNSALSTPLVAITAPYPVLTTPVLVRCGASVGVVKWYPPPNGAYSFSVQIRQEGTSQGQVGAVSTQTDTANKLRNSADGASSNSIAASTSLLRKGQIGVAADALAAADRLPTGEDSALGSWANAFSGPETIWKSTTLTPDSLFALRILGFNYQGLPSQPSPILRFSTSPRSQGNEFLTPRNAEANFVIECTGDICVGDTILITERLYEKSAGKDPQNGAPVGVVAAAGASGIIRQASINQRGKGLAPSASIRMDMSVMSIGGGSVQGDNETALPLGAYLGERTVAAHVVRDNYRTIRSSMPSSAVGSERFAKARRLWLEVVWQKASTDACRPYDLKPGVVVSRLQAHLEQFEVYRCAWSQEPFRRPLKEDWGLSGDCFMAYD